jgi:hypothetical protein
VIEGLGAQLQLDERQRQPSAQTLYHYGAHSIPGCLRVHTVATVAQPNSASHNYKPPASFDPGNTSSSTVWYSLGFIESCQGVKRGDIVWQASTWQWSMHPCICA